MSRHKRYTPTMFGMTFVTGRSGQQDPAQDPSGNPIELFRPGRRLAAGARPGDRRPRGAERSPADQRASVLYSIRGKALLERRYAAVGTWPSYLTFAIELCESVRSS